MYLNNLSFLNFKNYAQSEFKFVEKINCLVGNNGAGKTNVLDAIYYLSFTKSYFNTIDSFNIKHEEDFFSIKGSFTAEDNLDIVHCALKKGLKKTFKLNDKAYKKFSDHIGLFPLVIISPADTMLIEGNSEERRRFIDNMISQFNKTYLNDLITYNKALAQRNYLLKTFSEKGSFDKDTLLIYDEKLSQTGQKIFIVRKEFIEAYNQIFKSYYKFISDNIEEAQIDYQSVLYDDTMSEILTKSIEKDRILTYTSKGIHKDDFVFNINKYPAKKYGSQGQQKSFIIALKLAQFEYTYKQKGFKPLLLLDDIFDKLDQTRTSKLIQMVSEHNFGQVFITDTHKPRIAEILKRIGEEAMFFEIDSGNILASNSL